MEFPDLGKHCSVNTYFLPIRCDACQETFCTDHYSYTNHSCSKAYTKDIQVPVCPLCNQPVPIKRGELPDIGVSAHIDQDCQDVRAQNKRKTVFSNKCSRKGCKQKELVPVLCTDCKKNFCLKHRHPTDHGCTPADIREQRIPTNFSNQALSAIRTKTANVFRPQVNIRQVNGGISEDEALARALQASEIRGGSGTSSPSRSVAASPTSQSLQDEEDRQLAMAIEASQRDYRRNKDKCTIS